MTRYRNQRNPNFPDVWFVEMNNVGIGSPPQFITGSFTAQVVCALAPVIPGIRTPS